MKLVFHLYGADVLTLHVSSTNCTARKSNHTNVFIEMSRKTFKSDIDRLKLRRLLKNENTTFHRSPMSTVIRVLKSLPFGFERIFPDFDLTENVRVLAGEVLLSTVALTTIELSSRTGYHYTRYHFDSALMTNNDLCVNLDARDAFAIYHA